MEEAEVRDSVGFGCSKCREDIDFCDRCKVMFDYIGQKIYCDELNHFCEDCLNCSKKNDILRKIEHLKQTHKEQ